MLSNFAIEFVTELFLDDNVSTMNRLIVATANVVSENFDNASRINEALLKEQNQTLPSTAGRFVRNFYEKIVKCFSENEYIENFKMNKATVQVYNMNIYIFIIFKIKVLFNPNYNTIGVHKLKIKSFYTSD